MWIAYFGVFALILKMIFHCFLTLLQTHRSFGEPLVKFILFVNERTWRSSSGVIKKTQSKMNHDLQRLERNYWNCFKLVSSKGFFYFEDVWNKKSSRNQYHRLISWQFLLNYEYKYCQLITEPDSNIIEHLLDTQTVPIAIKLPSEISLLFLFSLMKRFLSYKYKLATVFFKQYLNDSLGSVLVPLCSYMNHFMIESVAVFIVCSDALSSPSGCHLYLLSLKPSLTLRLMNEYQNLLWGAIQFIQHP